jgi:AbrB family looped-hinge helix DNA binding protein
MQNIKVKGGGVFMTWAKVLRSGQVTFPKEIRDSFNIKEGDIIDFQVKGSEIVIRPKTFVDKGKAEVWKMFDAMHEKMKDEDPEKVEKLIKEAIMEVRREGRIKAQKK